MVPSLSFPLFGVWLKLLVKSQKPSCANQQKTLQEVVKLGLDENGQQCEQVINTIRSELERSTDAIRMLDFGAGTRGNMLSAERKPEERQISEIYQRAAATPAWGRFLYCLARELNPHSILELGTNLGISALHITSALEHNRSRLVTIEGDPALAELARTHLDRLPRGGQTSVLIGRFDDVLPTSLDEHGPFDLVLIDGHHEEQATLRYFETIKPHLNSGACVAFDDIEPFRPVRRAWKQILSSEPRSGYVALFGLGLWFAPEFDPSHSTNKKSVSKESDVVQ